MKIVEITEDKITKMSECVEEMLRIGGKLMSCIDELDTGSYGERNYGMRGGNYGNRMGYRDDEWDDIPMSRMGERRMRNRYGRFM